MANSGVTYTEVASAAQQLAAAGQNPTIDRIRTELGTGSNSTLGNHLRKWKERQLQTHETASKEHLPEELVAVLKGLWEKVMAQSDEKIQQFEQETRQEIIGLKQSTEVLTQENNRWQQQFQQVKQESGLLLNEKAALEQLVLNFKLEAVGLTEKLAAVEQSIQEKQERIEELHRQNRQTQANLEHYRAASLEQRLADQQRFEQQLKQSEQIIQQTKQELKQTHHEKNSLQQQNQQVVTENHHLKLAVEKTELQQKNLANKVTELFNELAVKTQAEKFLQTQNQALQVKFDEQNKSYIELEKQYVLIQQLFETEKQKTNEMTEQARLLAQEKWELAQEKAQLYGQLKQIENTLF